MSGDRKDELNQLGMSEQERASMERLLAEFRETAKAKAEQPELFWASMRTRVAARMREPQTHKGLGWAATLAAVTAMVVFVAVPSHTPQPNVTNTTVAVVHTSTNDDEALLQSIAETTSSDVPNALAPATILTSEMDRGLADGKDNMTGRKTQ